MCTSEEITERSLYVPIIKLFEESAKRYDVEISGIQEVETDKKYPDVLIHVNGHKLLIQVKIDKVSRLIEDIVKTYPIAKRFNAELVGILFPSEARRIVPAELNVIAPKLRVSRALILTEWMSADLEDVELTDIVENIVKEFIKYKETRIPTVNYLTIAKIARETIGELTSPLRKYMGVEKYFNMAQAIIGRFDFYKSLLKELIEKEEIMKMYAADIIAYLIVLQLLFSHIVSIKRYKEDVLPIIENPSSIPEQLITVIERSMQLLYIHEEYKNIIGSLQYLLEILKEVASQDKSVLTALGRYIYTIKVLRPEHVKEELLGRIYQEGLPPETRKNLGAFFTNPRAAKLLAELAINKWDEKVLDPACGSGTLLVAAYWTKMKRVEEQGIGISRDYLHELFIKDHIVGIDIMQFAKELTTINLALQNIRATSIMPKVYYGDGIEKMIQSVKIEDDDPPTSTSLLEYIETAMKKYKELTLPREGFDTVIMNPPFTRRERIPERERGELEKIFGSMIRGKVGYWAYFFAAADNVIKPHGKLATVTPEEFFAGRSAESLRRSMFLGENSKHVYKLRYVVKSAVEVAFSEGAHYRDYLVVFEKIPKNEGDNASDKLMFILLRKRKDEVYDEDIEELSKSIKRAEMSEKSISTDIADIMPIKNVSNFILRHMNNLKPLVGFYTERAQKLFLELINTLTGYPTIGDIADIIIYNPGQYTAKNIEGVEDYARRLFIARFGARGKVAFRFISDENNKVRVTFGENELEISKNYLKYSLRSPAQVKHMNVSGEHEYVITDINALSQNNWERFGFVDKIKLSEALKDVSDAYEKKACNVLISRRLRLTSPNIYWTAFYSEKRLLHTVVLLGIMFRQHHERADLLYKILTLYLNSSITLLQLLGYCIETEGGWVALHGDIVWSNIIVPDFNNLPDDVVKEALDVFNEVSKTEDKPLYHRIKDRSPVQRKIDIISLKMLGLSNWIDKLDVIYQAISEELDAMQKILEESRKGREKKNSNATPDEENNTSRNVILPLDKWLKSN